MSSRLVAAEILDLQTYLSGHGIFLSLKRMPVIGFRAHPDPV
jgi:hypothetical protein